VSQDGGGVSQAVSRAGEAYSIGENLSLSITKQDRACKYVSLR
jgi:hypothetical protein